MSQTQKQKALDIVAQERAVKDPEYKSLYERVMDRMEEFEETLTIERTSLGSGIWAAIKKIMYRVCHAAVYSSRKGIRVLEIFIKWATKMLKKANPLDRIKNAWNSLVQRKEITEEVEPVV